VARVELGAQQYDQVHDVFFAIGMEDTSTGEPTDQLLYAIDVQTGVATEVGNLGLPGVDGFFFADLDGINGLAYNPDLDLLYAITTAGFLLQIDPEAADVIAVLPSVPQLRGLAYDPVADELWGIASSGTTYRIDPSTGAELEQVQCDVPFSFVTSLGYVPAACGGRDVCSASTVLVFADPAALDLGDDLLLCEGEAFAISVSGFEQYLWQDGSADPSLEVTLPGTYVLTATDALGCVYVDSIAVEYTGLPDFGFVANPQPTTIEFTELTFLALDVPEGGTFDWTFESGDPVQSDASDPVVVFPPVAGTYDVTLTVITPEGCSATAVSNITIGTDGGLTLPNVFTPNGDGRNERFVPFEAFPGFWTLSVFDRWGNLVFETEDLSTGWDGGDSADGTYYFVAEPLEGQLGQSRSGHFTLMRNP
jgi:gliding motility-associated-like protein